MAVMAIQKPSNFSWLIENKVAGMAWPYRKEHLNYLREVGIQHLVTLSSDRRPPVESLRDLGWTEIRIEEFTPPTIDQINEFIKICEEAHRKEYAVGVHCWQGRGRTGVMLACYLVKFHDISPEMAVSRVRLLRPGSVETYGQERIVIDYNDYLRSLN